MCYLLDNRELAQKGFFLLREYYLEGGGEISSIISFLLYTIVCISFSGCRKSNQPSLYTCSILLSGTKKSKKKKKKEKKRSLEFSFWLLMLLLWVWSKRESTSLQRTKFFPYCNARHVYIYIYIYIIYNNKITSSDFLFSVFFPCLIDLMECCCQALFLFFPLFFFYFFGVLDFLWWFGCPYRPIIRY